MIESGSPGAGHYQANSPDNLQELINRGQPAEVLKCIDELVANDDWDQLLALINSCQVASVERGKPLWGCAAHGQYRAALGGPPDIAAAVMEADLGPMGLGAVPEVVASSHDFSEMLNEMPQHLTPPWETFIYECVARGDDVLDHGLSPQLASRLARDYEIPLRLGSWEPQYAAADFYADRVEVERPVLHRLNSREVAEVDVQSVDDRESLEALYLFTKAWTTQSNGVLQLGACTTVDAAVRGVDNQTRQLVEVTAKSALANLAWAGSSGGVHGRRPGLARGRGLLRSALGVLGDIELNDDSAFGKYVDELRWFTWDPERTSEGFSLAVAIEDPVDGVTFGIYCTDRREDDPV